MIKQSRQTEWRLTEDVYQPAEKLAQISPINMKTELQSISTDVN